MPFLLERLAARPVMLDGREEAFDVSAAIQAQIQRIFATRNQSDVGSAALIEWGLPNVVEIGSHDMVALTRYAEYARQAIARHEPRLKDVAVSVVPQPDPLTPAHLLISAALTESGEPWHIDLALSD